MKKLLSIILISAMIFSVYPCIAFAADTAELEAVVLSVKNRIEIPEEYSEFTSDSYTNYGETMYSFRWTAPADDYSYEKSINISLNSHGDIIDYSNYDYKDYSNEPRFLVYNEENMLKIAKDWLFSVNPSWQESIPDENISIVGADISYDTIANIFFERQINGLPFCSNFAAVSVDTLTGKVVSMSAEWTYYDAVPSPDEAMSVPDAEDAFFEKSPMTLRYINSPNGAILVYKPQNGYVTIDARTGEEFNFFRYGYSVNDAAMETASAEEAGASGGGSSNAKLTENELKKIAEISNLLTEEELRSIAENIPNTNIKDLTFISLSYTQYEDDTDTAQYTARLYYESTEEDDYSSTNIAFDAKTGELKSLSSYIYNPQNSPASVSYEAAVKTAEDFIKAYSAQESAKVKNDSVAPDKEKDIYEYSLRFNRYENDIPYTPNGLSVRIDAATGNITSFYKTWDHDLTFESPEGVISTEDAKAKLMEKSSLLLSYAAQQGESKTQPVIGMIYELNPDYSDIVSAKTGELLNYNGESFTPDDIEFRYPADISGHYAEEAITKLIKAGLLELGTDETTFRPDEPITQKDLIALIYSLRSGYIPYPIDNDTLARTVRNLGLTHIQIEPDNTAAREFAVKLIITVLGYDKAAELTGIYKTAFTDESLISADTLGYIAIAQGLNIISGNGNGYFKPQELLTRADAVIMIYNYLTR